MDAAPRPSDGLARDTAIRAPRPDQRSLLRFITCGSVDDGKSTLIGRLLFEAGAVPDDQLVSLDNDSARVGTTGGARDFALLVDGLAAEREQGITIDVAYRYFSTEKRGFIVADTPGHEQYTRNMATGASTADLAILLVDARKGLLPQTRRHSYIVATMGVRHVVVAVNKMDLVGFDEAAFRRIEAAYREAVTGLGFVSIVAIPVCAREGDNLAAVSPRMPWYRGTALLPLLEMIEPGASGRDEAAFALPVQWVNRPNADFRGFAGTVAAGWIKPGDVVTVLPSGRESRVTRIVTADGDLARAGPGAAVTLVLADDVDVSRGDVIVGLAGTGVAHAPRVRDRIEARLIVTGETRITVGSTFLVKLGTAMAGATVTAIRDVVDIESYATVPAAALGMNAIGHVTLRFDKPLVLADYADDTVLGGFILIERVSNETSAFGFVLADGGAAASEEAPPVPGLLERTLGPDGSALRRERIVRGTWRLLSASVVAGIVFAATGRAGIAILAGLADVVLRTIGRAAHDALWRKSLTRHDDEPSVDGGGI